MRIATVFCIVTMGLQIQNTMEGKTLVSVQKALDKKLIKAKAICAGGLSVNYTLCNLSKDSLSLMIPAGWRFNSNAGKNDYQDILVAHDEVVLLKPKESKTFEIHGYCCEADKPGPAKDAPYTIGKMADSNLVKIATFLNTHPADKNTEQYSVWAISNNKPTSYITSGNDSLASLIRAFVANIKHEPLPWFTLLKKAQITRTGEVNEYPVKLSSSLVYTIAKPSYSYFYVLDSTGQKVGQIIEKWLIPSENNNYEVNLSLRDFKKGSYTLVLETKEAKLFEREFSI